MREDDKIEKEIKEFEDLKKEIKKSEKDLDGAYKKRNNIVKDIDNKILDISTKIKEQKTKLMLICKHQSGMEVKHSYIEGSYYDTSQHTTSYYCKVCGILINEKKESGGYS